MYKYPPTLRSWLPAALCSVTVLTFSCQRKADSPQPAPGQTTSEVVTSQEVSAAQQAFAASGYAADLKEIGPDGKVLFQWQPQWNSVFKNNDLGAIYVPLLLADKKLANAKHFLVIRAASARATDFSLALYLFPAGQAAELVENSPAFLRTFTGKLAMRQLKTKQRRLYVYNQGRIQPRAKSATPRPKSTAGARTQACATVTTCYWFGYNCYSFDTIYLATTEGRNGECNAPDSQPCSSTNGQWMMYNSHSETNCNVDPDPNNPGPGDPYTPPIQEGWAKISVVNSGMVLSVSGGSTLDGAQVAQEYFQGYDNQIWHVVYSGYSDGNVPIYSYTPRSNYVYWQAQNAPASTWDDQKLGIMVNGYPTNAVGAPAQIWRMSTSTAPGDVGGTPSPFGWSITYAGASQAQYNDPSFGKYIMQNQYSGRYMYVSNGGSTTDQLLQWTLNGGFGSTNQQFVFLQLPI